MAQDIKIMLMETYKCMFDTRFLSMGTNLIVFLLSDTFFSPPHSKSGQLHHYDSLSFSPLCNSLIEFYFF